MLNIQKFPLNQPASERIRSWLGAEGSKDFRDWLVTLDAIATAEAGNLMLEAVDTPGSADEARAAAEDAAEIRRFIERLNSARNKDFQFERCEITPATTAMH